MKGPSLTQSEAALEAGETIVLQASIQPENTTENKKLSWTSSDEKITAVSDEGIVTAAASGTAVITVHTAESAHRAEAVTAVNQKPALPEKDPDDEETAENEDPPANEATDVEDSKDNHDSSEKNTAEFLSRRQQQRTAN